ncbi:MAG: hypothetical protein IPN49_00685 [Saprospiraceae bacterium]|nr:hypothetical protein [Saprospiraceae bacterium]MBK8370537.1 hypothetical protein [Saprospiraceae bacterium]MBK8817662.1 hypothetical protein [Saprospiraceae bacterium]MBK8854611.1 hypothetical protein [Saprospiraceae bacterium]MBK9044435.1 hypothetical protein [Saprospiraceae bacterium]
MFRVSSNLTLFLKLFIPIFWMVFFGMFVAFVLIYEGAEILLLQSMSFKIWVLVLYLIFLSFIYFTFFQLKRVEFGKDFYTVSNFFDTYRYIYSDIKNVKEIKLFRWILVVVTLEGKGRFGKKIFFLANPNLYQMFFTDFPEVASVWEKLKTSDL